VRPASPTQFLLLPFSQRALLIIICVVEMSDLSPFSRQVFDDEAGIQPSLFFLALAVPFFPRDLFPP